MKKKNHLQKPSWIKAFYFDAIQNLNSVIIFHLFEQKELSLTELKLFIGMEQVHKGEKNTRKNKRKTRNLIRWNEREKKKNVFQQSP